MLRDTRDRPSSGIISLRDTCDRLSREYPFQVIVKKYWDRLHRGEVPRPENVRYGASWSYAPESGDRVFGFETQDELDKFKGAYNV